MTHESEGIGVAGNANPQLRRDGQVLQRRPGLHEFLEEPDFAVLRLPNGDTVEVFGPSDTEHDHFDAGPVAGFLVDDLREARADLEDAGITFLGPLHESDDGSGLSHFRGPDGNVYEITRPSKRD